MHGLRLFSLLPFSGVTFFDEGAEEVQNPAAPNPPCHQQKIPVIHLLENFRVECRLRSGEFQSYRVLITCMCSAVSTHLSPHTKHLAEQTFPNLEHETKSDEL